MKLQLKGGRKQPETRARRSYSSELPTRQSSVFSYHTARPNDTPAPVTRARTVRPTFRWRHIPTLLALGAIILSIGYNLVLSPDVKVVNSTGRNDALPRSEAEYTKAIRASLSSSVLNRTKVTIDTQRVAEAIQAAFPEVKQASVTLPLMGHRPLVELSLRTPAIIVVSTGQDYVVDSDGIVIMKAADYHAGSKQGLPRVEDQSGLAVQVGKGILPQQTVIFITTFVAQLQAKKITVSSLTLPNLPEELQIRVAGQPYYIKTNLLTDPQLTAGQYLAFASKPSFAPKEYVDVRVEEKVFFK